MLNNTTMFKMSYMAALTAFLLSGCATAPFSWQDLGELAAALPRHDSFNYITTDTLSGDYFNEARNAAADPFIYIVVSNTGSAASKVIAFFTGDRYNHVSIAFDSGLQTLVSYNGGGDDSTPGLNRETALELQEKSGDAFIVQRLNIGAAKKHAIIDRIARINIEGSSYNVLGLFTKKSPRPNIMFCSQFVYTMLDSVNETYFEKRAGHVKPEDFIKYMTEA